MGCNCGKPKCDGKCGISPAVLQINNPSECTLFHRVEVPASMGDSKTNPPKNGAYKNVLLYYEADQTSWLYSSDGIPTKMVNGLTDYEAAINLPKINGETLIGDKSSADLKLADAPMVITITSDNTSWSGADTAEDIYNFFLNQGKVNVVFEGSENYGYEIVSAAYIPGEQKMLCMTTVASVDTGSSPVEFSGSALYGLMTFYTAGKAVDVGELDLQPKLFVTDFTGLNMTDGYVLEGVPATGSSIGMVKPGDGLEVASDGTLSVNAEITHTFDMVADMKASTELKNGDYARTLGFHTLNDGGGAVYKITNTGTANEMDVIAIGSLYANLVLPSVVTPEMFGAYGDGTHDDTGAWQHAVDTGKNVKAYHENYLVGTINVNNNIDIDCSNANFTCGDNTLLNLSGTIVATLTGENDYTANQTNYTITNADYSDYTGYAFIRGTNNFQTSRAYYVGGFACTFNDGKLNGSYPISATSVEIDIITPITANIHNIGNVNHSNPSTSTVTIIVTYGYGTKIHDIKNGTAVCYKFIDLSKSLNCEVSNLEITQNFTSGDNNSYIVTFSDSSYCALSNSYLYNKLWHASTTGGSYLCLNNKISNCTLLCDSQYAYLDHDNARYTTIVDSTIQCVGVSGGGFIDKVIVLSNNNANKDCYIRLNPVSEIDNANYTVTNCVIKSSSSTAATCAGILLELGSQQTGTYNYYMNNIHVDNVINTNGTVAATTKASFSDTQSTFYIGKVEMLNSNIDVLLFPNTMTHVNIDNYELLIENATIKNGASYISVLAGNCKAKKVTVNHSHLKLLRGAIDTLILNDYQNEETENATVLTVSSKLIGSNLKTKIRADALLIPTELQITDMVNTANDKWFNICNDVTKKYYTHLDSGTMTTVEVTYP